MQRNESAHLGEHLDVATELEVDREIFLLTFDPQILEPPGLGCDKVCVASVGERRPPPDAVSPSEESACELSVARRSGGSAVGQESFERRGVEIVSVGPQEVAAGMPLDLVRADAAAKLRDVDLDGLHGSGRSSGTPQRVDQIVDGHNAVSIEEESDEQRPLFERAEVDLAVLSDIE